MKKQSFDVNVKTQLSIEYVVEYFVDSESLTHITLLLLHAYSCRTIGFRSLKWRQYSNNLHFRCLNLYMAIEY